MVGEGISRMEAVNLLHLLHLVDLDFELLVFFCFCPECCYSFESITIVCAYVHQRVLRACIISNLCVQLASATCISNLCVQLASATCIINLHQQLVSATCVCNLHQQLVSATCVCNLHQQLVSATCVCNLCVQLVCATCISNLHQQGCIIIVIIISKVVICIEATHCHGCY